MQYFSAEALLNALSVFKTQRFLIFALFVSHFSFLSHMVLKLGIHQRLCCLDCPLVLSRRAALIVSGRCFCCLVKQLNSTGLSFRRSEYRPRVRKSSVQSANSFFPRELWKMMLTGAADVIFCRLQSEWRWCYMPDREGDDRLLRLPMSGVKKRIRVVYWCTWYMIE